MSFTPTSHEPCLYSGTYNGKKIYFLRQVDDFAIACEDESIAKAIIAEINSHMSVDIKYLGLVTRFNGVDILQTKEYIKVHGTTYIDRLCAGHTAWMVDKHCHTLPIPMKSESSYNRDLENAPLPTTDKQRFQLQRQHK